MAGMFFVQSVGFMFLEILEPLSERIVKRENIL
jgi:hypothetical protein